MKRLNKTKYLIQKLNQLRDKKFLTFDKEELVEDIKNLKEFSLEDKQLLNLENKYKPFL